MEKKEFSTDKGVIVYRISKLPDGHAPWLVFLPGLAATWRLFEKQIEHFSTSANILAWDAPSHGDSSKFPLSWSIESLAAYLAEILQTENIAAPVLIGQSMGGLVAQAYALSNPDCAAAVISIDSFPLARSYYTKSDIFFLKHMSGFLSAIPWKALLEGSALANAQTEYGREVMREMVRPYGKRHYAKLTGYGFKEVGRALESSADAKLSCPLLVICGENDSTGSVKKFNKEWQKRESVNVKWIPDAMHNSTSDNPDSVNQAIEDFLAKVLNCPSWENPR